VLALLRLPSLPASPWGYPAASRPLRLPAKAPEHLTRASGLLCCCSMFPASAVAMSLELAFHPLCEVCPLLDYLLPESLASSIGGSMGRAILAHSVMTSGCFGSFSPNAGQRERLLLKMPPNIISFPPSAVAQRFYDSRIGVPHQLRSRSPARAAGWHTLQAETERDAMLRIGRRELQAPAQVIDLELSPASQPKVGAISVAAYRSAWCLSRVNGAPRAISFWDVAADTSVSLEDLRDRLRAESDADPQPEYNPVPTPAAGFDITVVICTRDRPQGLRVTLESLRRQTDSGFRLLVVDNGSSSPETAAVTTELALPDWEYLLEPRPGLSRARNRGLEAVRTDLTAWIDDDEVADPDWVRRLKEGFAHESRPAAVCGAMFPAELEFEAQVRFEQYGGFNKGRGVVPEVLKAGTPSVTSPLYPLPAWGPGGNMAFRTGLLRAVGGFDPCLGAGTHTHGGEETRVLSSLLSDGHVIMHWPAAITWHTHRREMAALRKQFYGYSAGTTAFYMSTIRSKPSTIIDILRLAPNTIRDLRGGSETLRSGHLPSDFPGDLLKAARRGLLGGAPMYVYEALRNRRQGGSIAQRKVLTIASRP